MALSLTKTASQVTLVLMIALVISSCGRRGNPEAPPSAITSPVDENGEELPAVEKEDKPFILDPLL